MSAMVDDANKAKENRERIAAERENHPYYWWEYPDPFLKKMPPVSNPRGLARSRQELKKRLGKEQTK